MPGRARGVEFPVPYQERGEGKGESRIRYATILPPGDGDRKDDPTGGIRYCHPKEQDHASRCTDAARADHQEPIADRMRTEEDQRWNRR